MQIEFQKRCTNKSAKSNIRYQIELSGPSASKRVVLAIKSYLSQYYEGDWSVKVFTYGKSALFYFDNPSIFHDQEFEQLLQYETVLANLEQ